MTTVTIRSYGNYAEISGKTAQSAVRRVFGCNVNPVPYDELTDRQREQFMPWWGKTDRALHGDRPWGAAVNTVLTGEVRAIIAAIEEEK